jgi:hypothetical protein
VLVNLGGIRNPLHPQEASVSYARLVMTTASVAARLYAEVHVATSQQIASHMQQEVPAARTIATREVQHLLGRARITRARASPGTP